MLQNIALVITLVISSLALLGGIITVWVNTNVKIARIDTTVTLKIAAIEMSIAAYIKSNSESLHSSFAENKEEHKNLILDVKEIRGMVTSIEKEIVKLTK
jgi:hypothetical protein